MTAAWCAPRTSRRSRAGTPTPPMTGRSPSPRPGCSCRTSPACPPWSTWPPCATPWPSSAATSPGSTRWGLQAFADFRVVPPDTGIVHQVNLEYLARVVFTDDRGQAYPDTLVGTDSHTPMVNGLGVLGWGVGEIEA